MFGIKALTIMLGLLGSSLGLGLGAIAHAQVSGGSGTGWTMYSPPSLPRRYVDYLPGAGYDAAWSPGLAEYAIISLGAGVVLAVLLVGLGFRLTWRRSIHG